MPWLWPPSTQREQRNAVHIRVRMVPLNLTRQLYSFHEQSGNICLDTVASSQCRERMYYCLTGHAHAAWNVILSNLQPQHLGIIVYAVLPAGKNNDSHVTTIWLELETMVSNQIVVIWGFHKTRAFCNHTDTTHTVTKTHFGTLPSYIHVMLFRYQWALHVP